MSTSPAKTSGRVVYGARAFEQDAMAAMRGEVVRGLVELITNADDAYGDGQDLIEVVVRSTSEQDGVDIDLMPFAVEVHDRAKGLDAEGLHKCFAVLGGTNEAFQGGQQVRGLFGRGAKDVAAFGQVRFETVREGRYNRLDLTRVGEWTMAQPQNRRPDARTLDTLGIGPGQSGLTATIFVGTPTKIPKGRELADRLRNHAQLRNLLRRREVLLTDMRSSRQPVVLEPREDQGEVVIDESFAVGAYGDVVLSVRRLPAADTKPLTDHSEHGILISGRSATYENTFFSMNGRTECGWLAGEVVAPQIEKLVREFDDGRESTTNPQRLVARDRDGLVREHPFFVELQRQCMLRLLPILEALAISGESRRQPGERLSRAFATAQQALSTQMREMLQEIDETEPVGPGSGPERFADIEIIPPKLFLHPGEERTLTLRLAGTAPRPFEAEVVRCDPAGLLEITRIGTQLRRHPSRDAFSTTIRVAAGSKMGEAQIRAWSGESVAFSELAVVEPPEDKPRDVTEITFERDRYSVSPGRARNLLLMAPLTDVETCISVIVAQAGLVVPQPGVLLRPAPDGRSAEARIRLEAGFDLGRFDVTATTDDGRRADCTVEIVDRAPAQGLDLTVELRRQAHPVRRATAEYYEGRISVIVYAGHPTLKRILGPYSDEKGRYRGEDEPAARAVLAEVVGLELANLLVEREVLRRPEFNWDAARVLNKQRERAGRLVAIAQAALEER